ncbi:MAG: hypothetical protein V8Q17_01475 [Acutalibacteraceae bacterium]
MSQKLVSTIFKQISTLFITKLKIDSEVQQKNIQLKREKLSEVYLNLTSIINSFPNESPSDILQEIKYSPHYLSENFDAILISLDYQIEDYKNQLSNINITYSQKNDISTEISNREHAKNQIVKIRDKYYEAKDKFDDWYLSSKNIFDLYAHQNVKNQLAVFKIVIHNTFISGYSSKNIDNPLENNIKICRQNLIMSIRNDLGIK